MAATVSLATNRAQVRYHPEAVGARDLLAIIQVLTTSGSGPCVLILEHPGQPCPVLFQDLGFQAELEKTGLKQNLDHSKEILQ